MNSTSRSSRLVSRLRDRRPWRSRGPRWRESPRRARAPRSAPAWSCRGPGTYEQHMIQRLAALARRLDEDRDFARLRLADEFGQQLRTQRGVADIVAAALGRDDAGGRSLRQLLQPSRMNCAVSAFSPALRAADGDNGVPPALAVAEIDQCRDRIRHGAQRARCRRQRRLAARRRIDIGEGRRLVLQFGDDTLGDPRRRRVCATDALSRRNWRWRVRTAAASTVTTRRRHRRPAVCSRRNHSRS